MGCYVNQFQHLVPNNQAIIFKQKHKKITQATNKLLALANSHTINHITNPQPFNIILQTQNYSLPRCTKVHHSSQFLFITQQFKTLHSIKKFFSNGVQFYHLFLVFPLLFCLIIVIWFLDVFAPSVLCTGLCFFNKIFMLLIKKKKKK